MRGNVAFGSAESAAPVKPGTPTPARLTDVPGLFWVALSALVCVAALAARVVIAHVGH